MIAASADANLASITYYFGSKDELVAEALFGELAERLAPVLDTLEADSEPAPTRLLGAVQALLADYERSIDDLPVFLQALVLSAEPGPLGDRGRRVLTEVQVRLGEVIGDLKVQGVIAEWVEPAAMASLLVATAHGIALHAVLHPDGPAVQDVAGQLAGLLLEAGRESNADR